MRVGRIGHRRGWQTCTASSQSAVARFILHMRVDDGGVLLTPSCSVPRQVGSRHVGCKLHNDAHVAVEGVQRVLNGREAAEEELG